MRVLFFSHLFPTSNASAVGRFVEDQIQAVVPRGVDATIVTVRFRPLCLRRPSAFFKGLTDGLIRGRAVRGLTAAGSSYYELQCPAPRFGGVVQSGLYALCAMKFIKKLSSGGDAFDLIHVHTSLLDGTAGLAVARSLRIPLVVTEHTGPFHSLLRRAGSRNLLRRVFEATARIVTVSSSLRNDVVRYFPKTADNIQVLPNTFSAAAFNYVGSEVPQKTVGWLGYMSSEKRVDRLLETFIELKKRDPAWRLKMISTDKIPKSIMDRARKAGVLGAIEKVAAVERSEVAAALRSLSVLLITSDSETFSVACLEALAVGTPAVSTDCGGPRDIIREEEDGVIVDSNLALDLAAAVAKVAALDSPAGREGRANRALATFGEKTIGQAYVDLYEKLIRRS